MSNVVLLGLNERANRLGSCYEKIKEQDEEIELDLEFDYNEKALEAADKQDLHLSKPVEPENVFQRPGLLLVSSESSAIDLQFSAKFSTNARTNIEMSPSSLQPEPTAIFGDKQGKLIKFGGYESNWQSPQLIR